MKVFEFVAFNSSGKRELGTVKARSLSAARRRIRERGLYLASIGVQHGSVSHDQNSFSFFRELRESFFSKKRVSL
ncbi:MAG TPA: hypothetical protein VHT73_12655 [Thermodesulfobacteriota bacterium]|nr:hypothetical protein [Thermodesulfobacteriota bacterium]